MSVPDVYGLGSYGWPVKGPVFVDQNGNFLPGDNNPYDGGVPSAGPTAGQPVTMISYAREYGLAYGERRPFVYMVEGFLENGDGPMSLSYTYDQIDVLPEAKLVRYWTYSDWKQGSRLVREVDLTPGIGLAPDEQLILSMDDVGPNDMNWKVTVAFMITPPAETGFVQPFKINFFNTGYGNGDGGIHTISRASVWAQFSILPEPSAGVSLLAILGVVLTRRPNKAVL